MGIDLLAKNLAFLFSRDGTNAHAVAPLIGVSQPTLHRLENARVQRPSAEVLSRIAKHFGVTAEDLMSRDLVSRDLRSQAQVESVARELELSGRLAESRASLEAATAARKPTVRHLSPAVEEMEHAFIRSLPEHLRGYAKQEISLHGWKYPLDYCSEKIGAKLSMVNLASSVAPSNLIVNLTRVLWRLSSVRLLTLQTHPDRKYFFFVSLIGLEGRPGPLLGTLARITGEASLHNIRVVLSDAKSAAAFIAEVEEGRISDDYEDDEE